MSPYHLRYVYFFFVLISYYFCFALFLLFSYLFDYPLHPVVLDFVPIFTLLSFLRSPSLSEFHTPLLFDVVVVSSFVFVFTILYGCLISLPIIVFVYTSFALFRNPVLSAHRSSVRDCYPDCHYCGQTNSF